MSALTRAFMLLEQATRPRLVPHYIELLNDTAEAAYATRSQNVATAIRFLVLQYEKQRLALAALDEARNAKGSKQMSTERHKDEKITLEFVVTGTQTDDNGRVYYRLASTNRRGAKLYEELSADLLDDLTTGPKDAT